MKIRTRSTALLVLSIVVLFAPLAYADLPDQTWFEGLWDGGDNDDAIFQFESTQGGTVESFIVPSTGPVVIIVGSAPELRETTGTPSVVSTDQNRAPPAL